MENIRGRKTEKEGDSKTNASEAVPHEKSDNRDEWQIINSDTKESDEKVGGTDSSDVSGGLQDEVEEPKKLRDMYNYTPLDYEKDQMRFLVLKPNPAGAGSLSDPEPVECSFIFSPLSECEPYTYVSNTRGNPLAWWPIFLDDTALWLTRNILVFLNHIRSKEDSQRLWFRDVCLDSKNPEEKSRYWNPEWMEAMIKHADRVIDLSEVMGELWDEGKLPRPIPQREKDWLFAREPASSKHHPAPIESQVVGPDIQLPHKYLPLDYVLDEIRLVVLWKAEKYSDPLEASLSYTVMNDDTTYHCLSSTWGDEEATCPMVLNNQISRIRKNLDSFLRAARHHEQKFVVWVDDISIDSSNPKEHSRQLSRMLEIYRGADCVVSWLGEGDEDSDMALDFLEEFKKYAPVIRLNENGDWDVKGLETFPRRLAALYQFFLRPYFRRVWAIQELAVATLPLIFCGTRKVTADDLDKAAYLLIDILCRDGTMPGQMMEADPKLKSVSFRDILIFRRVMYLRHLQARGKESLFWYHIQTDWLEVGEHSPGILDVMVLGRDFESTSPRDKVFALWNLARDTEKMNFKVDSTRNLSHTWVDFAIAVAKGSGQLDIICAAEAVVRDELDIPSWCPDWSTPSTVSSLIRREDIPNTMMQSIRNQGGPVYYAAGKGDLTPRFSFEGRALNCAGVIADSVRVVGPHTSDVSNTSIFLKWLNLVSGELGLDDENEAALLSAFWSMLAGDVAGVWGSEKSDVTLPDGSISTKYHTKCFKPKECRHRLQYTTNDVQAVILRGRRLIITENGKMGLAPHYVEVGQRLAVLNCCSVPVLLDEKEDGIYRFAGSCFVQGWMEGEVLEELGETLEEAWEGVDLSGRLTIV